MAKIDPRVPSTDPRPGRGQRDRAEPDALVLVIGGPIARDCIPALCERVARLVEQADGLRIVCDVGTLCEPDAITVEGLARVQLTVNRLGRELRIRHAGRALSDLLRLMGLEDVILPCAPLPIEPRRQAE